MILIGVVVVIARPTTFGLNQGLNGASSGRAGLIGGGLHMFAQRPLWGFGSGAFVTQYRAEHPGTAQTLAASHTIAITIAAEQGLIGELAYLALVLSALFVLLAGVRGDAARAAIAAAFVALMLHTNLYADFLEDPLTWTLLGVGLALAARARVPQAARVEGRCPPRRGPYPSRRLNLASPRPRAGAAHAVGRAPARSGRQQLLLASRASRRPRLSTSRPSSVMCRAYARRSLG